MLSLPSELSDPSSRPSLGWDGGRSWILTLLTGGYGVNNVTEIGAITHPEARDRPRTRVGCFWQGVRAVTSGGGRA